MLHIGVIIQCLRCPKVASRLLNSGLNKISKISIDPIDSFGPVGPIDPIYSRVLANKTDSIDS